MQTLYRALSKAVVADQQTIDLHQQGIRRPGMHQGAIYGEMLTTD